MPDAIPAFVRQHVTDSYEEAEAARVLSGYEDARDRPVTLRANTLKASAEQVANALEATGIPFDRVPWYPDAFVLGDVRERAVWDLDVYKEGGVYLQSLSSMLPPLALEPRCGADILDMCAAPGGKTSQMAALTGGRGRVTAVEMKPSRADKLSHNLEKLGCANIPVLRCDARKLDAFFSFDQILLDAPCTGSGTFAAGDERVEGRITPKLLSRVCSSQRALLDRALTVLKPGGTLLYSTCSVFPEENDGQVLRALDRHRDCELARIDIRGAHEGDWALPLVTSELDESVTLAPTRLFEGFYMALITKKA